MVVRFAFPVVLAVLACTSAQASGSDPASGLEAPFASDLLGSDVGQGEGGGDPGTDCTVVDGDVLEEDGGEELLANDAGPLDVSVHETGEVNAQSCTLSQACSGLTINTPPAPPTVRIVCFCDLVWETIMEILDGFAAPAAPSDAFAASVVSPAANVPCMPPPLPPPAAMSTTGMQVFA